MKLVGSETVYYYNKNSKLWECVSDKSYESFMYAFLNKVAKSMKVMKNGIDPDEEYLQAIKKKIEKQIEMLDQTAHINNIIKRSSGLLQKDDFVTLLDSKKEYMAMKDRKKINLKTLEVSDIEKTDYFTFFSDVEYVENTPNADKFFSQIMPNEDEREYLRKVLGYNLTGEIEAQKFFIWYGHGSNGKSELSNLMRLVLNKKFVVCDESIFIKPDKKGGASPHIVALMNKHMGVYSEGESADTFEFNSAQVKNLSGEEVVTARALFQNPIDFYLRIKLNFLTNFVPPTNAEKAMVRRLDYLFFKSIFCDNPKAKNEFKKDPEFIKELKTKYLSEVFSWVVKGSKEYYDNPTFVKPKEFENKTKEILSQGDSIDAFITRKLIITKNDKDYLSRGELFEKYKEFANKNSQACKPRSTLFQRLETLNIRRSLINGYDVFRGIQVKEDIGDVEAKELNMIGKCNYSKLQTDYIELLRERDELQRKYNILKIFRCFDECKNKHDIMKQKKITHSISEVSELSLHSKNPEYAECSSDFSVNLFDSDSEYDEVKNDFEINKDNPILKSLNV
jgi:P4 family phage/plasmid primase-like protien